MSGQQLVIRARSLGFIPQNKPITIRAGSQTADFTLKQDVNRLQEVVVTGVSAGTEQKKLPFTVAHVDDKDMPVPGANPLQAIQGKVPGATIAQTSGRPGASEAVLLRGPQSINASGRSQNPLYIVDGIEIVGALPDLNPQDIESVEVVKGAAASSLYGSRAGNGVIQITTKSGRTARAFTSTPAWSAPRHRHPHSYEHDCLTMTPDVQLRARGGKYVGDLSIAINFGLDEARGPSPASSRAARELRARRRHRLRAKQDSSSTSLLIALADDVRSRLPGNDHRASLNSTVDASGRRYEPELHQLSQQNAPPWTGAKRNWLRVSRTWAAIGASACQYYAASSTTAS